MKLPVSREKYELAIQERDQALEQVTSLVTENERLTEELATFQNADVAQQLSVLQQDNERLAGELTQATAQVQERVDEIAGLNTRLGQSNTRIEELEQTVERLNTEGAVPPSRAASETDEAGDPSISLNEFMKQNQDDTLACVQRLREEGF